MARTPKEALIKWLRGRIAALRRTRKLAYRYDRSRFLRAVRLALHPARCFNQRFHNAIPGVIPVRFRK